jgi:hypothetical protein
MALILLSERVNRLTSSNFNIIIFMISIVVQITLYINASLIRIGPIIDILRQHCCSFFPNNNFKLAPKSIELYLLLGSHPLNLFLPFYLQLLLYFKSHIPSNLLFQSLLYSFLLLSDLFSMDLYQLLPLRLEIIILLLCFNFQVH